MFLHIGGSKVVFHHEIIGIFNSNVIDSETNTAFLEKSRAEAGQDNTNYKQAKSLILTDHRLYCSPISPATLCRRNISPGECK